MENEVLKKKAENTVKELDFKIQQLKSSSGNSEITPEFEKSIETLNSLRDKIQDIYKSVDKENSWSEFGKLIYRDLESFNKAYTSAGTFFKPI